MKDFLLSLWRRLFPNRGGSDSSLQTYEYEEELFQTVHELSFLEERPEEQVMADLLTLARARKVANDRVQAHWDFLSPREQQIAALVCLNYTNEEISAQLHISQATVASHIRNVLYKFNLHSKTELSQALAGRDFDAWDFKS